MIGLCRGVAKRSRYGAKCGDKQMGGCVVSSMVKISEASQSMTKTMWDEDLRKLFSLSSEEEAALNSFFLTLSGQDRSVTE